eukprot:gnl/TRDRNA2_/TRDRNA2_30415_c0_seq1.p1 gnl/TRDRNA2_/TRDRNA2_30415_c0~~gnl/TRDRNA2_/TRDRNA2_30415_c0_seq1.p1  ORF type:complete len:301 (+),score=48.90 gnl/TRDRNA2_/TRDRNA2_30415_c0_seq1:66-905(+)
MDGIASSPGEYSEVNGFLKALHEGGRRQHARESQMQDEGDVEVWDSKTQFSMSEVVDCRHAPGAKCLQCVGRSVFNVKVTSYSEYCQVFQDVPHFTSPSHEESQRYAVPIRSLVAGEVVFASFAAMMSGLCPAPGEQFLDLGSGVGRAVVAFALIFPQCSAAGIEIRESLHGLAVAAAGRLRPDVRQRVNLHRGDMFELSWQEASLILLNSTGFDDALLVRCVEKLSATRVGTRVVTLSVPLPSASGGVTAPPGLELLCQAPYRMTWGNATAYVYRRTC